MSDLMVRLVVVGVCGFVLGTIVGVQLGILLYVLNVGKQTRRIWDASP